jgi:hypothetical protein
MPASNAPRARSRRETYRESGLVPCAQTDFWLHFFPSSLVSLDANGHGHTETRHPVEDMALVRTARAGYICQWGATRGLVTAMPSSDGLFKGRPFDREIIVLCVRWYLRYKLSYRDQQAGRRQSLAWN